MIRYQIADLERLLLSKDSHFNDEQQAVIECWDSKEINACPGSGKTTVLLAKLKILADNMPLANNRGVCALSHTNVAVNEIKAKFGDRGKQILTYPHFVGTIQSFVDEFVAFPFIRKDLKTPLRIVDNHEFALAIEGTLQYYPPLRALLKASIKNFPQFQNGPNGFIGFIESIEVKERGLQLKGTQKLLASNNTRHPSAYEAVLENLLEWHGLLRYDDAYRYAEKALLEYGEELKRLISKRFRFVFVDEYQDCSQQQRNFLDSLFDPSLTIIQKIGDVDQAIYFNDQVKDSEWKFNSDCSLPIAKSNRFTEDIALVLSTLKSTPGNIVSSMGSRGIKPKLIVHDEQSRANVLPKFAELIAQNELDVDGCYKAIGFYKNVKGLRVGSYWKEYQPNVNNKKSLKYTDVIDRIALALDNGKLFLVVKELRQFLLHVCRLAGARDEDEQKLSSLEINDLFLNQYRDILQAVLHNLISVNKYSFKDLNPILADAIQKFPVILDPELVRRYLSEIESDTEANNPSNNLYVDVDTGIKIFVDNVHGVKGETHDATLYLETEYHKGTDMSRVLQLLSAKSRTTSKIHEKSRKCVYVGFSRPRYLLCVTVQKSTYEEYSSLFSGWDVISIHQSESE